MKANEAIRNIMKLSGVGTNALAARMGKSARLVSDRLSQENISVDKLNEMLRVMGYKLMVVPREARTPDGGYVIDGMDTTTDEVKAPVLTKKEKKSVTNPETGKIVLSPTEDLIRAGYLTVQQAMERGWKPTPEFLDYILDNEGGNANADA